ncbi:MAG: hypothetical protein A3I01_20280 [Betaproteobacteria bacterium RIFCSPLOWO2_02_FULL_65_24]|nr:MAG: hypothetical protein A3I01_20280 [Betaproteobacteria bacterium RIFCSPLOWO2_02_FULL_65_24]
MRQRIAAAAARLMAEDGIDDFALAKRKAARQLGAEDTHSLPGNEEIEEQLRAYHSLYRNDEQQAELRLLREQALAVMQLLKAFSPYLSGPVLRGTAGRYSDVDLQLFTDDEKSVELLLLNRGIPYAVAQQRRLVGDQTRAASVLRLDWEGTTVKLAVFPANDERSALRSSPAGRPIERAALHAVAQLVQQAAGEN